MVECVPESHLPSCAEPNPGHPPPHPQTAGSSSSAPYVISDCQTSLPDADTILSSQVKLSGYHNQGPENLLFKMWIVDKQIWVVKPEKGLVIRKMTFKWAF